MGSERISQLAYDRGTLEIMTPLLPHEYNNRLMHFLSYFCTVAPY
jgi:hypothetical protein